MHIRGASEVGGAGRGHIVKRPLAAKRGVGHGFLKIHPTPPWPDALPSLGVGERGSSARTQPCPMGGATVALAAGVPPALIRITGRGGNWGRCLRPQRGYRRLWYLREAYTHLYYTSAPFDDPGRGLVARGTRRSRRMVHNHKYDCVDYTSPMRLE